MHLIRELELAAASLSAAPGPAVSLPSYGWAIPSFDFDVPDVRDALKRLLVVVLVYLEDSYDALRGKMQIYATSNAKRFYVKPGQNPESDPSDWYADEAKKEPIQFQVVFDASGRAEVSDTVGRYLCAQGLAKKSRLIIPTGMKAA